MTYTFDFLNRLLIYTPPSISFCLWIRSFFWMSLRLAWTQCLGTRSGPYWRAVEQAELLSSALITWTRQIYLQVLLSFFTFLQSVIYASISHTSLRHTDRKAVISQGQLKCVGSSLYLKTKCGVGYHLRLVLRKVQKTWYIYFLPVTHCCCYVNTVILNLL